jgi:hypothetical protein
MREGRLNVISAPYDIILNRGRLSFCPYCNSNTLELYDIKNNPMYYDRLLDIYKDDLPQMSFRFNSTVLTTFRCKICRRNFRILWVHGFPEPDIGVYIP